MDVGRDYFGPPRRKGASVARTANRSSVLASAMGARKLASCGIRARGRASATCERIPLNSAKRLECGGGVIGVGEGLGGGGSGGGRGGGGDRGNGTGCSGAVPDGDVRDAGEDEPWARHMWLLDCFL
jgi:hypothetical protein